MNIITARITTVKESDWQREMAHPANPDGLRERLQARTLAELSGAMNDDEVTLLSIGQEREFTTGWKLTRDHANAQAGKTEKHVIGTEMRVERLTSDENAQETRLLIRLTHDLLPPQLQSMTYATAAVGAERDRRSVTAPRFERLRWQGVVQAGPEEHMIASFPSPQDASMRIVVFFQGGAAASKVKANPTLQHTLYRVPELDLLEWMLQTTRDDAAVVHHLEEAVSSGKASIISSATLSTTPGTRTEAQVGTEHWVPSQIDQYFDQLYLIPTSFQSVLQGTRLSYQVDGSRTAFESTYVPHPPLAVQWPTSWLRVPDEKGVRSKALHGWMNWPDHFEEQIQGDISYSSAAPHLVAMMPPADQVWGTDRKGRWLDVTVAQQPDLTADPASKSSKTSPRRMFIGIALDSDAAHALLASRSNPEQDDLSLLRDLLARTRNGKARVMTCALAAHDPARRSQTSARLHAYPDEMPSIPSAWQERRVGTELELDGELVALTQHLSPPARTEWKLARDMPEAIMWEPRFRHLSMSTSAFALAPGTHLLTAADVPAVMISAALPAHETLLLFSHLDYGTESPAVTGRDFEIETLIFETSVKEAAAWQGVKSDDFESFSQQQLKSGRATLQSHALLRTQSSPRVSLSVVEEYQTAVGFDPPTLEAPFRMRPTALEMLPVGLQCESEMTEGPDGTLSLNIKLQHSTAKPIEPSLEETLRISADAKAKFPGAKHELDEWTETISPTLGKFHRLLPPSTTTSDKGTTRIAWVRVRPVK